MVQLAKKEVFGLVDMDSFAGPSDVLIVANEAANPAWVAADMLSQAEHNPGAGLVVTDSEEFAGKVLAELETQMCATGPGRSNRRMPDRLQRDYRLRDHGRGGSIGPMTLRPSICRSSAASKAGISASGWSTPERSSLGPIHRWRSGDYWRGARATRCRRARRANSSAPLPANDFVKSSSIIEYSRQQLADAADDIVRLALTEGLDAHAKSVQKRVKEQ